MISTRGRYANIQKDYTRIIPIILDSTRIILLLILDINNTFYYYFCLLLFAQQ